MKSIKSLNIKTDDLSSYSAFSSLVWLVRASRVSKLFALITAVVIAIFLVNWLEPQFFQQNLMAAYVVLAGVPLLIGLWVFIREAGQAQGRSAGGQLGHILKGILLAGLVLVVLGLALYFFAKSSAYHPSPAPIEYQTN